VAFGMCWRVCDLVGAAILPLFMMVLWAWPVCAGRMVPDELPVNEELFTWELRNATVVTFPQVMETDQGTVFTGYTIEADATCLDELAPLHHGTFHLNLTIYSPANNTAWEQAAWWTLRGSWSITRAGRVTQKNNVHHGPVFLHGDLNAVLPFNPLTQAGFVRARIDLSMRHGESLRGSGSGTFSGNERFVGAMTMSLIRRAASNRD
jgi:hypothetical protein